MTDQYEVWKRRGKENMDAHSSEVAYNRYGFFSPGNDTEAKLRNGAKSPSATCSDEELFNISFEALTRNSTDISSIPMSSYEDSSTLPKWPISIGDTSRDETYPEKLNHLNGNDSDEDSDDSQYYVPMTFEDKEYLLERMQALEKEQQELRRKQEEHDASWTELLHKGGPCVQKSLRSISRSFRAKVKDCPPPPIPPKGGNDGQWDRILDASNITDARIHVQLEQLYSNFQVLHFPTTTAQQVFGQQKQRFFFNNNNNNTNNIELARLREENSELRSKIEELESKLRQRNLRRARSPTPISTLRVDNGPGMKPAKSEGRLDEIRSPITRRRQNFVAGRPMSVAPKPAVPKDIHPTEVIFKWIISDYQKKFHMETFRDGNPQISDPFYLTHCGFKAQMEAYLNGNGTARNRCLSVFLRIFQGEYDAKLKWPASLHLTVILLNQSGNQLHCLKAGGNQFQYNRPIGPDSEDGECWGLIEFVSHEQIRHGYFIKDDKIVLMCRVQF